MKKFIAYFVIFTCIFSVLFAEKIAFSADSMTGQAGNSSSDTRLVGNAYILTETMEITADLIELSGEDYKNIRAEGNVNGKNLETKMEFKCSELDFDRITKIARLQGDVNLVDSENDVSAKAQIIEYNQDTDVAILQIQVNLTQKDNICSGAYAVYLKKDKMLDISGNAQVKQKSDTFRAQQISLNLDTQAITLAGNVRGSVVDSGKKEEPKNNQNSEQNANQNVDSTPVENPKTDENAPDKESDSTTNADEKSDSSANDDIQKDAGSTKDADTPKDSSKGAKQ